MYLTEDAARTRYCPLAFGSGKASLCVAGACMAWRWAEQVRVTGRRVFATKEEANAFLEKDDTHTWVPADQDATDILRTQPVGYCGLVPKP